MMALHDIALVGVYLLLLCGVVVGYRRGRIPSRRLPLLLGMCAVWLSYGVGQLSSGGPVDTGTGLNYALDGFAVVLLVAGCYGLYWWWRHRDTAPQE